MAIGAYIRVSSLAQNYDMQRDALTRRLPPGTDVRWYSEKRSAKTADRPELRRLLADVRAGLVSELHVFKLDRLVRTGPRDAYAIIGELRSAGCTLHAVADGLTIRPGSDDVTSEVLVFAFSLAAKLERAAINDRIAAARERMASRGEPWGRPPRMSVAEQDSARALKAEGRTVREIAQALGVPRSTVARVLKA